MSESGSRERIGRPRLSSRQNGKSPNKSVSDSLPSVDQSVRKPRIPKASSPALVHYEEIEAPLASGERITPEIRSSQFVRIRAWVKYGMTAAQVARVYGVAIDMIERILTKG